MDSIFLRSESFRCGVFFSGPKNKKPRMKIYIIPKRFPTDCSVPDPEEYKKNCTALVMIILNIFLLFHYLFWESAVPQVRRP